MLLIKSKKIAPLLLLIIFLFVQSAIAVESSWIVVRFGSLGEEEGKFNQPKGIAVDKNRNILIVDAGNNRIQKFDEEGNYLSQFGQAGQNEGEFFSPSHLAIDTKGNIFVVDTGNQRVQKFTKGGIFKEIFVEKETPGELLKEPEGIAIDFLDNVYITDMANNCVYKFNKEANLLWKIGSLGKGKKEFNQPTGITLDKDLNIYVVDTGNQRVQKFDRQGNFLFQFGSKTEGSEYLRYPQGIALDKKGNIYVVDTNKNIIQKFNPQGKFIAQFSINLSKRVKFNSPVDLAIDSLDYIYAVDRGNNRIVKIAKPLETNIIITGEGILDLSYANVTEGSITQFFASHPDAHPGLNLDEGLRVDARTEHLGKIEVLAHFSDSNAASEEESDDSDAVEKQDIWLGIEGQKFGMRLGIYRAPFNDTEFSRYSEILTGIKVYTEISDFEIEVIGAKIKDVPRRDEIEAEEMELTYTLSRWPVIEGSEKVKVNGELKKKDIDYEIDYLVGRIVFSQFLEPDSIIIVEYRYIPEGRAYEAIIYGIRGKGKVGRNLTLGATFLEERNEVPGLLVPEIEATPISHSLYGVDISYDLPGNLDSFFEYAQSELNPNLLDEACIDDMEDEKRWAITDLDSENDLEVRGVNEETDPGFTPYPPTASTSSQALSLRYTFGREERQTYVSVTQNLSSSQDFSPYGKLEFGIFKKEEGSQGTLSIDLMSSSEDFFRYTLPLNFPSGWRTVSVNLDDFTRYGLPLRKTIVSIRLYIKKEDAPVDKKEEIYIDALHLKGVQLIKGSAFKVKIDKKIGSLALSAQYKQIGSGFTMIEKARQGNDRKDIEVEARYDFAKNVYLDFRYKNRTGEDKEAKLSTGATSVNGSFSFPLTHKWGISNLTTNYQVENSTDYTQGQPDLIKNTTSIKSNISFSEKISLSGTYSINEDRTFSENPSPRITTITTTTLGLKAKPNKISSVNSSYSVKKTEDSLIENTSHQTTTANVMLEVKPSRIIVSNVKYEVKTGERIANSIGTKTTTLLNLKITPSHKLSVRVSYQTKNIHDMLKNITISSDADVNLAFTIKPRPSLSTMARYTMRKVNRVSSVGESSTTSHMIFAKVNYIFSKSVLGSASYTIRDNGGISMQRISQLGLIYNLNQRTKIKGDMEINSRQEISSDIVKSIISLGLEWSLSKNISLEGEYDFINFEDKNQGQNSYHANTGNLFVKINF